MHVLAEIVLALGSSLSVVTIAALRYVRGEREADERFARELQAKEKAEREAEENAHYSERVSEAQAREVKAKEVAIQNYLASLPILTGIAKSCPVCGVVSSIQEGKKMDASRIRYGHYAWEVLTKHILNDPIQRLLRDNAEMSQVAHGPCKAFAVKFGRPMLWQVCHSCGYGWLIEPVAGAEEGVEPPPRGPSRRKA